MPHIGYARRFALALLAPAVLALAGCGLDMQTLKPYNQAQGVNVDGSGVKVRNLLVVADNTGKGVLVGTLVSTTDNELASIAGVAQKGDLTDAGALTVTAAGLPAKLPAGAALNLANPAPQVKLASAELKPGLTAKLTLTLATGEVTVIAPVMGADNPDYKGLPIG